MGSGPDASEYTRMMVAKVARGEVSVNFELPSRQLNASIWEATDFLSGKDSRQGYTDADALEKGLMHA